MRWVRHKAILVETVRVNGKPRQKHVAFIASYVQGETPEEIEHQRITFWRDARQRLDQLGNRITSADRVRIEAALAQRVTPTTAAEGASLRPQAGGARAADSRDHPRLP